MCVQYSMKRLDLSLLLSGYDCDSKLILILVGPTKNSEESCALFWNIELLSKCDINIIYKFQDILQHLLEWQLLSL